MERPAHHAALRQSVVQRERDDAVAASGIENTKAWSKQRGAQEECADALRVTHQPDETRVRGVLFGKEFGDVRCGRHG